VDALLWDDLDKLEEELRRIVPILKEKGGYIFSTDHSIPSNVSLEDFRYITDLIKDIGSY
jgi:uroporphyrinogen decarboxylase